MNDAVANLNGTIWIFAAVLISMVIVQAVLFLRLALRFNKKHAVLTKDEISQAAKTGAISAVGPSLSSIVVALSLIALVGPAVTFMRCGVIGAPSWELFMADIASKAVGVPFGSPEFTQNVFVLCIFGMTFASAPYFINTIITLKPLDKAVQKEATKKEGRSFIPYLSNAAMMGLMGYSIFDYFSGITLVVALATACIVSYIVMQICKKTGSKTLASFNMAISMVVGMAAAQITAMMIG